MDIFDLREFDGHELIVFGHDAATSLRAIIAIHSTALGPAAGGCRMWPYATTAEAVSDVLRLSRGMSYKNALAGVPFGGGKAVIIGEARKAKTPELFEAFGRFVDRFGAKLGFGVAFFIWSLAQIGHGFARGAGDFIAARMARSRSVPTISGKLAK